MWRSSFVTLCPQQMLVAAMHADGEERRWISERFLIKTAVWRQCRLKAAEACQTDLRVTSTGRRDANKIFFSLSYRCLHLQPGVLVWILTQSSRWRPFAHAFSIYVSHTCSPVSLGNDLIRHEISRLVEFPMSCRAAHDDRQGDKRRRRRNKPAGDPDHLLWWSLLKRHPQSWQSQLRIPHSDPQPRLLQSPWSETSKQSWCSSCWTRISLLLFAKLLLS